MPGLTVMQAIAVAGGLERAATNDPFARDLSNLRARQALREGTVELTATRYCRDSYQGAQLRPISDVTHGVTLRETANPPQRTGFMYIYRRSR